MDQRRAKRAAVLFMAGLLLAVLAAGCGGGSSKETTDPLKGTVLTAATPTVGMNVCTSCHSGQTSAWLTSRHANLDPAGNLYSGGSPTLGLVSGCASSCHDPLGDSANLTAGYTGNTARPVVGCESCHGGGSLHVNAGGAGPISLVSNTTGTVISAATLTLSGQFVMCTSCHELLDMTSGDARTNPTHSTGAPLPNGDRFVITDSHFATAGTYSTDFTSLMTEDVSYSMNFASSTVCTNCHNPHGTAEINREWAASGHAYRSPDDSANHSYNPWLHYNWTASSRKACQRCHTTTGFAYYADALRSGNYSLASEINAGDAPALEYDAAFKPEMLQCTGCHTDNDGRLRNPGAYAAAYGTTTYQYADQGGSNVCLPCHVGRNSGEYVKQLNSGFDAMKFNVVDPHYLAAGATMFGSGGYEYSGRNYANPSAYKHDKIGTSALAIDAGANGPCVGCHMHRTGASGNHTFSAIATDSTGTIIGITSEVCFNINCHAGSNSMLTEIAEAEREEFEAALVAFAEALVSAGFTPTKYIPGSGDLSTISHPYFGVSAADAVVNWLTQAPLDADTTGNTTGKNNMGAALNFGLLHHEPGGYVHNSKYAKRLIYDSIDWLDDNSMNYSVGNFLEGLAIPDAVKYLLNGGQKQGNSAERP